MDKDIKIIVTVIVGIIALLGAYSILFGGSDSKILGGAGHLQTSGNASTTDMTLGNEEVETIATTTICAARIISTGGADIRLTFSNAETPTGSLGTLQTSSTTVVYENDVYGCGLMRAFSFDAQTINITETQ